MAVERVALELELEEVIEKLDTAFDEARAQGKLAQVPELIREARAAIHARAGS